MASPASDIPKHIRLYGFQYAPFRLSPDPYFFFPTSTHTMAERIIAYALEENEGFMVLTGAAGLGKTLLLQLLLAGLREEKVPALIVSSAVSPLGLLQLLLGELGVPFEESASEAVLFQRFQETVLDYAQEGLDILIVVDEAQNMSIVTLEQLRMLSNIETGSRKLLQILLIGQENLEETLRDKRLAQLVQRIVIHEHLRPLTRNETERYVEFRLKRAGRQDIRLTRGAVRLLQGVSDGVPRMINKIMDRALLLAGDRCPACIRRQHVRNAVVSMKRQQGCRSRWRRLPVTAFSAVVLLSLVLFFMAKPLSITGIRVQHPGYSGDQTVYRQKDWNRADMGGKNIFALQPRHSAFDSNNPPMEYKRCTVHPLVKVDYSGSDQQAWLNRNLSSQPVGVRKK